jgi:hypothetical protein
MGRDRICVIDGKKGEKKGGKKGRKRDESEEGRQLEPTFLMPCSVKPSASMSCYSSGCTVSLLDRRGSTHLFRGGSVEIIAFKLDAGSNDALSHPKTHRAEQEGSSQ